MAGVTNEAGSGGCADVFNTTHWSVIAAAVEANEERAEQAWAQLAKTYWRPLYAFIRRSGYEQEDAKDLTQAFFAHMFETRLVERVVPRVGRFRSYLLVCLKHFLVSDHRRTRARIRCPEGGLFSLDETEADREIRLIDHATPETQFDSQWAATVMQHAVERLRSECKRRGRPRSFALFEDYLKAVPYSEVAARFGISEGAVKTAMERVRKQYRLCVREEVALTVPAEEIEEEVRYLFRVLTQ